MISIYCIKIIFNEKTVFHDRKVLVRHKPAITATQKALIGELLGWRI